MLARVRAPDPSDTYPAPGRLRLLRRSRKLPEGWPLLALFAVYPLWWALGLGPLAAMLLAIPLAWELWRSPRRVVIPVGTGLFLMFLVFVAGSGLMIGRPAPGTTNGNVAGTILAYGYRFTSCVAGLVVLVYVSSSNERRLPTGRIINALSVLFVVTVMGGWLGILILGGGFTSPLERFMPHFVRTNGFAATIIHPGFSQIQDVLGYSAARPKAPFEYSNTWGGVFSLLLPFHLMACHQARRPWIRAAGLGVLGAGVVPVVLSLNRGLWIALGVSCVFAMAHLVRRGQVVAVVGGGVAAAAVALVLAVSPLADVVSSRLANPHSNEGRSSLYAQAFRGAMDSPLLGWGGPRQASVSGRGITTGESAECPDCGTAAVGTQGTFWTVLFSTGFIATGLFVGFFLGAAVRAGRQTDTLAASVCLVLILFLGEQLIYDEFPLMLVIAMTGIGLLTRRSIARRSADLDQLEAGDSQLGNSVYPHASRRARVRWFESA